MQLHEKVAAIRGERLERMGAGVPDVLQGVDKVRIKQVLGALALGNNAELIDGVFALLDDQTPSWFSNPPPGATIANGASTAHLACHVGILQRGSAKLDREGRDYWIKPLRELGGLQPVFLNPASRVFIPGHPVPKSPNSAYQLAPEFKAILQASDADWQRLLREWVSQDAIRRRKELQAQLEEQSRALVDSKHSDLIASAIKYYVPHFLQGYEVIYVDDGDGDRITQDDKDRLSAAGIGLQLGDAMPDVLLWNRQTDWLWVIEAVTSDGEVDTHKMQQLSALAARSKKRGVGFTTAYRNWKEAAARQNAHKNIAAETFIWIEDDPGKQMLVRSMS